MNLARVESAVRDRLGLDPASLGPTIFPRAVEQRMRVKGVSSPEAYLGVLAADPDESAALSAELLVPETWFFRGGRALFERLAEFLAGRLIDSPNRRVRALSLPCSTGEEPYSLAIAAHERLIPPDRLTIDAIDLSAGHLDRAIAGRYQPFSFREAGQDIRPTYFRQQGDRWEILPHIRSNVRFRLANAADPTFLASESPYDVIVCRNLFIYLTPEAKKRAMASIERLLAPDGWLCLTPGEADRLPTGVFRLEGPAEFGIYRRAAPLAAVPPSSRNLLAGAPAPSSSRLPIGGGTEPAPSGRNPIATPAPAVPPSGRYPITDAPEPPASSSRNPIAGAPASPSSRYPVAGVPPAKPPAPAPDPKPAAPSALEAARELADSGRLVEAREACEKLLTGLAGSAGVYSLLGIIAQADGRTADAAEAFRRALYLDPDHAEALSHMIVVCERRGDAAQAAVLRRRLARLNAGEQP